MGELGRGVFVSACQTSASPFSWSYDYYTDSSAPCPAKMLDLKLAVGSEVGVYYDALDNWDEGSWGDAPYLMSASTDLLSVEDGSIKALAPGLCALIVTTPDRSMAYDLIHVQSEYLDNLEIIDATFAYADVGTPVTEEGDALVIYGTGNLLDVAAIMRSSDARPLGGRRSVDWEASGPITFHHQADVDRIFDADITMSISVVAEAEGEGMVTVRDRLTGIEGKRRIVVR